MISGRDCLTVHSVCSVLGNQRSVLHVCLQCRACPLQGPTGDSAACCNAEIKTLSSWLVLVAVAPRGHLEPLRVIPVVELAS